MGLGLASLPALGAPSGSISGRVVDADGAPIAGVCVNVESGPGAQTDGDGLYSITEIDTGSYKVTYRDCNATQHFVSQWYLGHADSGAADPVSVTDGADTPLQDLTLATGVVVQGTVTDTNGQSLSGINVNINATTGNGSPATGTQTDANGQYSSEPLPPGSYRVRFSDNGGIWAAQYWNATSSYNDAAPVLLALSDGPAHTGVDAQLSAAAKIEGTVTATDGAPLEGICVDANTPRGNGWDGLGGTSTAADGTYVLTGLPAVDVRVQFRPCNGGIYVAQWYAGQTDFNRATPIVLSAGDDRTGIDGQLETGIEVSGHVTDADGNALSGIGVSVQPIGQGNGGGSQTDGNGDYTTGALSPGDYRVQFSDHNSTPTWATQYWHTQLTWESADTLTLGSGDAPARSGVDAALTSAATISGTVTGPDGQPAANVCVNVATGTPNGVSGIGNANTANDGTYSIGGLPETTVKVQFQDCNGSGPFVDQFWNDKPDYQSADPIVLSAGDHRTGIDAQLALAGAIRGTITDADGHPLGGICAQATTESSFGGLGRSESNGHYSITLPLAGRYRVQFVDCNDTRAYAGQWWPGQATQADAHVVAVSTGEIVDNIDAALDTGATGTIAGKVANVNGVAMTDSCVIAYLPNQFAVAAPVGQDGTYLIADVPSGTYSLAFLGCSGGGDPSPTVQDPQSSTVYTGVWWHGVPLHFDQGSSGGPDPIAQGANFVTVTSGQSLTSYDWCFGCTAIAISAVVPQAASLDVAFATPGIAAGASGASAQAILVYTASCTSLTGGASGSATGSSSPLTVTGLTPGATYTCQVKATDGRVTVATSAVSQPVVLAASGDGTTSAPGAVLAFTGAGAITQLASLAFVLVASGLGLVLFARRRRARA